LIDLFKKIFFILIISTFLNPLFAQNPKSIKFSFTKNNIAGGYSVKINSKPNSSALFVDNIHFKTEKNTGFLEFNIFPEGYEQIKYKCRIDTIKQNIEIKLDLEEKIIQLKEVIVSSKRNRFTKNGDTISVYVEDIQTKPQAEASEFFDRITGFENIDNGTYKIFGSSVDIVLIDGKRIYGGNPALTLSNIKADMIKAIDIIENNSRIGSKKKVINLKLKSDKKSGTYGNFGLGKGSDDTYDLSFKANKLLNSGIFSSFGTANNISLFKLKILNDNELVEEFYSKNSFFGYQNKSEVIQNLRDEEELNAGIFKDNSIGTSLNFDNKKTNQSINILLNKSNQSYQSNLSGITTSNNKIIETQSFSDGNASLISSNISYGINTKFGKSNALIFKVESKIKQVDKENKDSLYFNDGIVKNNRFLKSFRNNDGNYFKVDFGAAFNYKNKRVKTLIFSKLLFDNQNSINTITTIPNAVVQKLSNFNFMAEVVQSYPLSKRILVEQRPFFSSDASTLRNKFIGNTAEQTVQRLFRLDNWIYFQQGKVLVNADLAIFHYNTSSNNQEQNFRNAVRVRKVNIKFPKSEVLVNFDFNYENDLVIPSNLERIGIPDSLNFNFRQIGNDKLTPFFSKKISVSYSNANLDFINLMSSFDLRVENQSIQNDAYFVDNLLFVNSRKNIEKQLFSLNGNTFISIKKLPAKIDMSINHIFTVGQAYSFFNNQPVIGNSNFHLFNFQTMIRGANAFSLKNVFAGTYTSFQNLQTTAFEHTIKVNFNIRNELFSKITFKSVFGSSIPFQPLLNIEFQKFIVKNKIGLEIKAINLMNVKNNSIINQTSFQQFVTQNNNIPRVFMFKISFYPEKWR
jgi:hypothetical protein